MLPELIPARMLNEYVYCPRLFFLEWVDRSWAPSSDTAEDDRVHRRVDAGGGAAPLPEEGVVKAARAVELASERLGIVAKLDLLEGTGGGVVPVDTKKGHPARTGSAWEANAVQVCAQELLLREHGYRVERGEIFYEETRQRVHVEITPELEARTLAVVSEAREVAERLAPPAPLRESPKCARCSLITICLPDELHVLAARQDAPARRLIAADPDAVPLHVTEQGSVVGIDGGRLTVSKHRDELISVRLIDVLQVSLFGNVQVTAQAARTLIDRDVDVFHFTYGGWLIGMTTGLPSKNVTLRMRQLGAAAGGDLNAPRRMIAGKIRNCRVLLQRNGREQLSRSLAQLAALAEQSEHCTDAASLLGIEGTAARLYFESFPSLLSSAIMRDCRR
jgi:CRISP-associated protein Cas1